MGKIGTCEICGITQDDIMSRCKEHLVCDHCGTPERIVIREGGVFCDQCFKKIVDHRIASFNGDTSCTDNVICPYCGCEWLDSWELSDSDGMECDDCGNSFSYERDCTVTYASSK